MIVLLVCAASLAYAGGRKRIVVLEFSGPKAEKFHDDLVKLIKKQHTVVPIEKWNSTAEELDAANVTEKNIKKVAKKLKVDGVVTGKIEKRRDEYIVHLKLRAGTSGEQAGQGVDTKSESGRLDGKAGRDVKEELMTSIDDLEANHGGGGGDDDEADKPSKKKKETAKKDEDEDEKPAKKTAKKDEDEDEKPVKKGFSKKTFDKGGDSDEDAKPMKKDAKKTAKKDEDEDEKPAKKDVKKDAKKEPKKDDEETTAALSTKHDEDDTPLPKSKKKAAKSDDEGDDDSSKKKKKVAKKDDEGGGGDEEASSESDTSEPGDLATQLSPSERAIEFGAGMSFTARRMTWDSKPYLTGTQIPPAYTQSVPVAGAVFDATVYPLAFGHKRHDMLAGAGVELTYDKVLFINSKKLYGMTGMQQVATLDTSESRFAFAGVFRYPLGKGEKAPVIGGKLAYETQSFEVKQQTPDMKATDIPNVEYSIIEPSVFFAYPAIPKLTLDAQAGFLVVTGAGTKAGPIPGTGDIGNSTVYGQATASGFELAAGAEYSLTTRIFARGVLRIEKIGFTFKNDPATLANTRDTDNTTQDVTGASDMYFGGFAMVGFLY